MSAEKELFNMVYQWGRVGVVADHNSQAFKLAVKEVIKPKSQKITCPNCDHQFAWGDAQISEEQRAIYELHQHGHSIRAIGRMFGLAPESVRYRLKEVERNKYVAPTKPQSGSNKLGENNE